MPVASIIAIAASALAPLLLLVVAPAEPSAEPLAIDPETTLTLTRVVETRAADLVAAKEDDMLFSMPSDQPGLFLQFSLQLPAGTKVMHVQQPKVVTARDSNGTDLSKIKPGFGDELEYVELEHDFKDEDDVSDITLQLACSARAASTFDVSATFEATIFTGSKPLPLEIGAEWLALPPDATQPGKPPRVRATEEGLLFEPAEIEAWIEKIDIQTGPNEVIESNGWFSDGSTITYSFTDLPPVRPLKATLTLRTGVKTIPLTIAVKAQALP
jgi:hypothetical protein